MYKKVMAGLLAACLLCMGFAGCKKEEKTAQTGEKSFTYWMEMPSLSATSVSNIGEISMYQEMERRTGVKVEFIHPPSGQGAEKFNLMMASKDFPDVIEYNWAKYQGGATKALADGVAFRLNDIMEEAAPNFTKILKDNPDLAKAASTMDGSYYGFPRMTETAGNVYSGLMIRQDWLEDLNMEVPETIDEWETMLRRFKNEKGAIAPLTLMAGYFITESDCPHFNSAYGVGEGFYINDEGKVSYGPAQDAYKDYLTTMNRWYEEGLLDKEFATINGSASQARVLDDQSGAFYGSIGSSMGSYLDAWAARGETNKKIVAAQFPVLHKGDEPQYLPPVKRVSNPQAVITTKAANPKMIASWLDYFYSKEGAMLAGFGIEGETYTMDGDLPVYTELITNNPDGLSVYEALAQHCRPAGGKPALSIKMPEEYLVQDYPYEAQREALLTWSKYLENSLPHQMPALEYSLEASDEMSALKLDINSYAEEMIMLFIQGEEPLENFGKYQQTLQSMKLDKLLEIMQTAYDQYMSK
ncbi:MAG: extracellular solute-binding protein [Clostridia bacterium]